MNQKLYDIYKCPDCGYVLKIAKDMQFVPPRCPFCNTKFKKVDHAKLF